MTNKHGLHVIILLHGNTGLVIYNHLYTQAGFFYLLALHCDRVSTSGNLLTYISEVIMVGRLIPLITQLELSNRWVY